MRRLLPLAMALGGLLAGRSADAAERVDYLRDVKPLLMARCSACHGALQQKAGLRVDTAGFLREGGDSGPAVLPGRGGESLLIAHVTGSKGSLRMPPASEGEGLQEKQIALLRAWIDQGATGPADEKPEPDPRDHWAFRAPVRPPLPASGAERPGNPVDAFLAAERRKRGLAPQPPADRRILLRRVYLDLVGLPPTREEQAAFLADDSPDAFEKVVDRLLASKQYGERWGRHWMDVWRYSDWWGLGAEVRNSQKHIWHWRDWILEALNADKGYDQMLREMLAADELYPDDLDKLRATGFLARSYFRFNRNTWLEEVVEHTSKAFLGLTVNCAKCHDHKYDPISQADYYRLRAFFEPYQVRTEAVPGETDFEKDGIPRAFDCNLEAPTYRFVRGDEKRPLKDRPLSPGLPPLLSLGKLEVRPVTLPPEAHAPGLRPFVLENHLQVAEKQVQAARAALAQARQALAEAEAAAHKPGAPATGPVSPTRERGDPHKPEAQAKGHPAPAVGKAKPPTLEQARAAVQAAEKALAAAEAAAPSLRARAAAQRARLQQPPAPNARDLDRQAAKAERQAAVLHAEEALARAELDLLRAEDKARAVAEQKRNAARDTVARERKALESPGETFTPLRGALKTPENNLETESSRSKPFPTTSTGRRTALAKWLTDPRHPLTARVAVNHVWARHFGKPLVPTVFDFGRKGAPPTHPALLDYLAVELMEHDWSLKHLHRLLVASQAYRLSSSGSRAADPENRYYWRRNPVRMEAQVVRDSLLQLAGELDPTMGGPSLNPVQQEASRRRSLYFVHSHNDHHKFLSLFDDASVLECYRRTESIVPQQALALSNSKFALEMAGRINDRLHARLGTVPDIAFIRAAFEHVLAASPTPAEQAECEKALGELKELLHKQGIPDAAKRARGDLIHALLNHNDFIAIR
jgi:hypothetical protein